MPSPYSLLDEEEAKKENPYSLMQPGLSPWMPPASLPQMKPDAAPTVKTEQQAMSQPSQLQMLSEALKGQKQQVDLSPLAALAESQTGVSAGYKVPENLLNKKIAIEDALRKQQQEAVNYKAGLMKSGMVENPITHEISFTPAAQMQKAYEESAYDPNSERSKRAQSLASGILKEVSRGGVAPNVGGMSAAELGDEGGLLSKYMTAKTSQERNEVMAELKRITLQQGQARLEERQNVNSSNVGKDFEKSPVIANGKKVIPSIDRAEKLLTGDVPATGYTFNLAMQDFINAVAAGGVATEGKMRREMPETFANKWNEFKVKYGTIDDVRKAEPAIIKNLLDQMRVVKNEYKQAMADQALDVHDNYLNSSNQKVRKEAEDKLKRYNPAKWQELYGTEETKPEKQAAPKSAEDVNTMTKEELKAYLGH